MNVRGYNIYIVTFALPPVDGGQKLQSFEYFLRFNHNVLGYWNYIPLVYCFKSRLNANELRAIIFPILEGQFILTEVNPDNMDGALPGKAWEWFYSPPEERSAITGLLGSPTHLGQLGKPTGGISGLGGLFDLGNGKKK
jgi:hypothetical protein